MKLRKIILLLIIAGIILFEFQYKVDVNSDDRDGTNTDGQSGRQSLYQESGLRLRGFWRRLFNLE